MRAVTLNYLSTSSGTDQIAEMETKAAKLERRGVNLEWGTCEVGILKRLKPCFRSDGKIYGPDAQSNFYAVPHSAL